MTAYTYPLLLKQLWHTPLQQTAAQEIVYRGTTRHTYQQTWQRIQQLALMLSAQGVVMGDTVAVMDWDSHRYLECYFAVPSLGATLFNVNVRLASDQVLYTLNHAEPKVLLLNREFLPVIEHIAAQLTSVKTFILLDDEGGACQSSLPWAGEYEALLAEYAGKCFIFPDFDENTRATLFYTTGTTGLPKGVYFSHRQLVLHTLSSALALGSAPAHGRLHREDVYMPITPMFHVHAWGLPYVATLLGIKQVYPGRYLADHLLHLIEQEHVTFSQCVPTILHMLLKNPLAERTTRLRGLKMVIGGSALPSGLAVEAARFGMDVFTGYGMSETCPILTLAHLSSAELALSAEKQVPLRARTGQTIPLVDLRVVSPEMQSVIQDDKTPGEVVVRSPWLTQGYYKNIEASADLWAGGYLHTNDIGVMDVRGSLRITDRLKDVIKTGGEWISSLELESRISEHPAVSEVAVVAVPDAKWGERPMALVVLKPKQICTVDVLRTYLLQVVEAGHLSKWAVPDEIRFVDTLERTSVGKLNKVALRKQYC